jgi:hypothetical protein
MGGQGSGGHNSKGKLRDVQCARLDVHELARDGKLTLGKRGTLFGTVGFEVAGGPDAQRIVLEFPVRSASGERLAPLQQVICCYWRRAHYGGRYLMFLCPECTRSKCQCLPLSVTEVCIHSTSTPRTPRTRACCRASSAGRGVEEVGLGPHRAVSHPKPPEGSARLPRPGSAFDHPGCNRSKRFRPMFSLHGKRSL